MSNTLKLCICEEKLRNKYEDAVNATKTKEYIANPHKDSGFDLFMPECKLEPRETRLIDLGIKCAASHMISIKTNFDSNMVNGRVYHHIPNAYYLYPRSSIYKTPFRLANCVGIIDSGYRGNLMVALDNTSDEPQTIQEGTRLFQICMPDLKPFKIDIVKSVDLTIRGSGGFGSTGV